MSQSVKERLEALRSAERNAWGDDLARIRRQIAMLTEDQRKPMSVPEQGRRFR